MATIRIPSSAEILLPFCRTSNTAGPHLWETYADMITFLAAYAYGKDESPVMKPAVVKTGNPIDLGVFRSRGLYPILLTVALAAQRNWQIAKQPDALVAVVEGYAAAGANSLCAGHTSFTVDSLTRRLSDALERRDITSPTI